MNLKLECGECHKTEDFEGEKFDDCSELANTEGWRHLSSTPIGRLTSSALSYLCPRCFGALQFKLAPPTLTMSQS
jgi:hypothetical protein